MHANYLFEPCSCECECEERKNAVLGRYIDSSHPSYIFLPSVYLFIWPEVGSWIWIPDIDEHCEKRPRCTEPGLANILLLFLTHFLPFIFSSCFLTLISIHVVYFASFCVLYTLVGWSLDGCLLFYECFLCVRYAYLIPPIHIFLLVGISFSFTTYIVFILLFIFFLFILNTNTDICG